MSCFDKSNLNILGNQRPKLSNRIFSSYHSIGPKRFSNIKSISLFLLDFFWRKYLLNYFLFNLIYLNSNIEYILENIGKND